MKLYLVVNNITRAQNGNHLNILNRVDKTVNDISEEGVKKTYNQKRGCKETKFSKISRK